MPHTVTGASVPGGAGRRRAAEDLLLPGPLRRAVEHDQVAHLRSAPVQVGARLRHALRNGPLQVAAPQLALHHVAPLAPAPRPHDQQVGPASPQCVLPLDPPAAVHDSLQVRLQQELRSRLVVLFETLHPMLGVLPEERLERRD